MTKNRPYNVFGQLYTFDQYLKVDNECNAVTFINRGSDTVYINGIPLAASPLGAGFAGESIAFSGNENEVYKGMIEIKFEPAIVTPIVCVVQKFYLDPQ